MWTRTSRARAGGGVGRFDRWAGSDDALKQLAVDEVAEAFPHHAFAEAWEGVVDLAEASRLSRDELEDLQRPAPREDTKRPGERVMGRLSGLHRVCLQGYGRRQRLREKGSYCCRAALTHCCPQEESFGRAGSGPASSREAHARASPADHRQRPRALGRRHL